MLFKSILALAFASVGLVQAVPIRYAYPIDLDSNPGVRPLPIETTDSTDSNPGVRPLPDGKILPYIKREPLRFATFDPQANPGVRPLPDGKVHILPYYGEAAKREPLKLVTFDPQANPGVRPLPNKPANGEMHILPYYGENVKREPLRLPFDPQANPGVRPLRPLGIALPEPVY
jgi:hypothetical protein